MNKRTTNLLRFMVLNASTKLSAIVTFMDVSGKRVIKTISTKYRYDPKTCSARMEPVVLDHAEGNGKSGKKVKARITMFYCMCELGKAYGDTVLKHSGISITVNHSFDFPLSCLKDHRGASLQ